MKRLMTVGLRDYSNPVKIFRYSQNGSHIPRIFEQCDKVVINISIFQVNFSRDLIQTAVYGISMNLLGTSESTVKLSLCKIEKV